MVRGNKYGARKADCQQGHRHDSRKEAKRCNELTLLERAGVISQLELHPQFWFHINEQPLKHRNGRRVGYNADFTYIEAGVRIVEDVKGYSARDWPLRRALFEHLHPEMVLKET